MTNSSTIQPEFSIMLYLLDSLLKILHNTAMIVIFSGSSGSGKNTVINELLAQDKGYSLMPTFTTRQPRQGEKEGAPYFFVSQEEFKSLIANNELYEHEEVHEQYYGTPKSVVADIVAYNKICLKDIDVLGAMNLKQLLSGVVRVVTIYFHVDKDTLAKRLIGRGETQLEKRLERYDFEFSFKDKYDYVIQNNDLLETVNKCKRIIEKEKVK